MSRDAQVYDFLGQLERHDRSGRPGRAPVPRQRAYGGIMAGQIGSGRGGFAGARVDRTTEDWQPGTIGPNLLHRMDARMLRERARNLVLDNPLAKGGVEAYVNNVIECGITPKPQFEDRDSRRRWTDAWDIWGGRFEPQADITGCQTIYELQALWLEEIIIGGGCLLHFVDLPRDPSRLLPLGIELLPEERFADDADNYIIWRNSRKGENPITRGVETDPATGRAVAYWVTPTHPNDLGSSHTKPIRLPAERCRYAFFKKRAGQVRGWSMMHAAISWLWKLGYFTDNELMASAIKSCFGVVISGEDDDGEFSGLSDEESSSTFTDVYGNTLEKMQPGIVARIGKDSKITAVGPNTPGGEAESWILLIERSIGVALDLSYEELARDYSQGNFSSTRASANADRRRFRRMQRFVVSHFCMPVWKQFAMSASRVGVDGFPRPSQLVADLDEWLRVTFRTPGWQSVNPVDDAKANEINLSIGTTTRERITADAGTGDVEENFEQLAREEDHADALDIDISGGREAAPAAATVTQENEGASQPQPTNSRSRRRA